MCYYETDSSHQDLDGHSNKIEFSKLKEVVYCSHVLGLGTITSLFRGIIPITDIRRSVGSIKLRGGSHGDYCHHTSMIRGFMILKTATLHKDL